MTEKKKATGTLDGWVAKKNRGDDVDGCTTVATTVVENMECDGNSSSSSNSSSTTTTTTTTTQRLTDVTAISTELNCSASDTTTVLSTHPICPLVPSSSSSSSPYHAYNIRDDQHAPREVLDAAIALRIYIHENTEGGMGLIIHRFHIRRRDDGEKKKAPKKGKGRPDDYSDWCVHCDVCDKPNSLVSSFRSNPPLYIFQTQHLGLANHLANGQRLLFSMDNAAEVTTHGHRLQCSRRGTAKIQKMKIQKMKIQTTKAAEVVVGAAAASADKRRASFLRLLFRWRRGR